MQQYFVDQPSAVNDILELDKDILHHLIKVLRKGKSDVFRICDPDGKIFFAHLVDDRRCILTESCPENNELDVDITCILSLIKNDHFELCIQKLVELGVKRIVPYAASRSVVKVKDDKKLIRLRKIAREAAEQSHRNLIPEVTEVAGLEDISRYMSDHNYICYEAETDISDIEGEGSISFVIGPEGGFTAAEFDQISKLGFRSVSLGKRILRAETAALYAASVIVSRCQ